MIHEYVHRTGIGERRVPFASIKYGWIRSWNLLRRSSRAICPTFWSFSPLEDVHTKWSRWVSRYKITLECVRDESESTSVKDEMNYGKKKDSNIRAYEIHLCRLNGTCVSLFTSLCKSKLVYLTVQLIQIDDWTMSSYRAYCKISNTCMLWNMKLFDKWKVVRIR